MTTKLNRDNTLIIRLKEIVETNLNNSQFGVNELAAEIGLSRSQLHRRIKANTGCSISQFINKIRLEKAMKILQTEDLPVSEIAYKVGFGSPAYFSRCFHTYYGFPPGEAKNHAQEAIIIKPGACPQQAGSFSSKYNFKVVAVLAAVVFTMAIATFWIIYEYRNSEGGNTSGTDLSIIVLPFQNMSDDSFNDYFADGIREDILNNLYWITSLRVVSRTSAEQFRGSTLSASDIAKKMKVKYVLEGSVRREKDKARITVQLIDASKHENHLWAENFDREIDNIIGLQDEIALQVASKLKTVLSENELQNIERISTQNPKAYDYFLKARFLHHKTTSELRSGFDKEGVQNCLKYYEMAIAEDENFAEAYAELAWANFNLSAWKFIPTYEGFTKAQKLSLKALEIDSDCSVAHATLAAYNIWGIRNFEEGRKRYELAIKLNPNYATARQGYAQFLMISGPIEEARKQVNHALNLEPNFWVIQNLNSWIYYFEGKYKESLDACILANDYNPNFSSNHWLFVINYAKLGEGEKMKEQLKKIAKRYSGTDDYTSGIEQAFLAKGINGLFQWMIDVNKSNPIKVEGLNGHPFFISWWNAMLGNDKEAMFWLEKVLQEKRKLFHYFNLICTNPDFQKYQNNTRFVNVVNQIGLSPYLKQ